MLGLDHRCPFHLDGVAGGIGFRGDSYDNAMAEALNSVYEAELIDRRAWSGLIEAMAETSKWIGWYNRQRPHSTIGYRPPFEIQAGWTNLGATASVVASKTKKNNFHENRGLASGRLRTIAGSSRE